MLRSLSPDSCVFVQEFQIALYKVVYVVKKLLSGVQTELGPFPRRSRGDHRGHDANRVT